MFIKKNTRRIFQLILISVATGVVNNVYAGWNDHYSEGGALEANRFTNFGPSSTATAIDQTKYEKLNLSMLNQNIWVPKPGVVIPVDEVAIKRREQEDAELRSRLGGYGGWNTP